MTTKSTGNEFNIGVKFGNAAVAGITGVTINFPVDLCKTRLQNAETGPNGEKIYKSLLDCAKKTYRAEGFFGMYRGWAVNTLLITPEKCIKLGLNDLFCHHFGGKNGSLQWYGRLSAGGLAGACQIVVTTPMELLKIQLQDAGRSGVTLNADGTVVKKTALGISKQLYAERGFLGLYKGFRPTFLRDVIFSTVYFPLVAYLNDWIIKMLGHKENEKKIYVSFASAFISGAVASVSVNPFDVVKTRLQTLQKGKNEKTYAGITDCFRKIYMTEGWTAFYKGGTSRIIAIAILFGVAQTVYWLEPVENTIKLYAKYKS
ncbi:SLC25A18_22 [Mytilus coruscus]|uniref:SLC25A18_22 n=1 Tax=Mytilus coruscus TaxID=42192 RepID=A0A6J8AZ42_MYTCO|nr:SLC25A18_22 [Mytilus coruscus]